MPLDTNVLTTGKGGSPNTLLFPYSPYGLYTKYRYVLRSIIYGMYQIRVRFYKVWFQVQVLN